jgi:hypothetical protein
LELTLNLAWLVLSAALVITCRKPKSVERRAVLVIALICLIAFLFPVISITDDLNGATVFTDGKRSLFSSGLVALAVSAFVAAMAGLSLLTEVMRNENDSCSLEKCSPALNRRPPPALY